MSEVKFQGSIKYIYMVFVEAESLEFQMVSRKDQRLMLSRSTMACYTQVANPVVPQFIQEFFFVRISSVVHHISS